MEPPLPRDKLSKKKKQEKKRKKQRMTALCNNTLDTIVSKFSPSKINVGPLPMDNPILQPSDGFGPERQTIV